MSTKSQTRLSAIARIIHALERIQDGKLVWFLAGGVALCRQQHDAVKRAIPSTTTKLIVGSDGPELWGSERVWSEVLDGVDVVFSTFAVLHEALSHVYVRMSSLALLVFDEAHHVTKKHPSNLIMRDFYHENQRRGGKDGLPAILGLTASPAENGKPKKVA